MCNVVDENLEKFLEGIETKTGEPIKDEISKLTRELKNNSEEPMILVGKHIEWFLIKLSSLKKSDNIHNFHKNYLDELKDVNEDIRKLATDSKNFISKALIERKIKLISEKQSASLSNKIHNDNAYYNMIKVIKKDIIKYIQITKIVLSGDKKEYYDSLLDDIQYLIIYKLCFLMVIREQEIDRIESRRIKADKWITDKKIKSTSETARNDPFNDAMGLALSGGGIRSAAFNLGVLQALERGNILKSVDYLSSVSGGGYIASSLTWFMSKDENSFPFGKSRRDHSGKSGKILSWLRDHGNYLTPGNGMEFPSLVVAVLTSVLINMLILLPPILSLLWIFSYLQQYSFPIFDILFFLGIIFLILTFIFSLYIYVRSSSKKRSKVQEWCHTFKQKKLHEYTGNIFITGLLLLVFGMIPDIYKHLSNNIVNWIASISLSGITSFLSAFKGIKETNETKGYRSALLTVGLSLIIFGIFLGLYHIVKRPEYPPNVFSPFLFTIGFLVFLFSLYFSYLLGRIDINHVSIHRYYRNRLMEAFMPWAIIGENRSNSDDFRLTEIPKTRAPYHIINTTVNMVGSEKTKQRERGGDCFILSPLFCGSEATGYAATKEYIEGKINLATAFAVSGASVNPNTYVTRSKPITFLMTLFNARLGYWIKNPSCSSFQKNTLHWPYFKYIIYEMFGRGLNETNEYVHLSDGGHFENLGLYELVRRRCRYIIVSDASNDPNWTFGDLARVIEMVRVDFGAEVNLDTRPLQPKGDTRIADRGFIRGTVTYKDGKIADLIYINTVIIDGLPEDIYSYRRTNQRFPDQTTSDQFFDEKQFEAYRELGFQLGFDLCGKASHEDFTAIFKKE